MDRGSRAFRGPESTSPCRPPDRLIHDRQPHAAARQIGDRPGRGKTRPEENSRQFLRRAAGGLGFGKDSLPDGDLGDPRKVDSAAVVLQIDRQALALGVDSKRHQSRWRFSFRDALGWASRFRDLRRYAVDA